MNGRAENKTDRDEIIQRIADLWEANPDLTLMRLIGNVFLRDPYYIEDYQLMETLEAFYTGRPKGE
jgi:hypothetical protein